MPQMSHIFRERAIGMLTAGMSTRAVACELNVHFSTISRHIQHLHLQDRLRPSTATIGLHNQRMSAQTVRNCLREAHLHALIHCTGQMADSVYGVVWVSGLLISTLWIEWPMVAAGLWYGQAYVMDNGHRLILLMPFWMHRDTVTRSWGPLLCHSTTTISSCCSMIMHGPMLQGSVHNSWMLKTSQFLHGQHTDRTCHPLNMFGMLWIGVYDSVFQFLPISSNFAQPLKRSGPTFHNQQPDQLYAKEMCCTAWGKWWWPHF